MGAHCTNFVIPGTVNSGTTRSKLSGRRQRCCNLGFFITIQAHLSRSISLARHRCITLSFLQQCSWHEIHAGYNDELQSNKYTVLFSKSKIHNRTASTLDRGKIATWPGLSQLLRATVCTVHLSTHLQQIAAAALVRLGRNLSAAK